jgi:tellurite resistance protein
MLQLTQRRLESLRDQLKARGRRPSMVFPSASPQVIEAVELLEEYGPMCEALYLMMAADRRVLNVEREVARGALDVLSDGRLRTTHMEAMLDSSARRVAEHGVERCLADVIESLRSDPVRAETTVLLAAAVAAADNEITPEEHDLLDRLARGLELGEARANELLEELSGSH